MAYTLPQQLYGGNVGAAFPSQPVTGVQATDLPLPTAEINKHLQLKNTQPDKIIETYLQNLLPVGWNIRNQTLQQLLQMQNAHPEYGLNSAYSSQAVNQRQQSRDQVLANLASRGMAGPGGASRMGLRDVEADYIRQRLAGQEQARQTGQQFATQNLAQLMGLTTSDLNFLQQIEAGKSAGQKNPIYGLGPAIGGAARALTDTLLNYRSASTPNTPAPNSYGSGDTGYNTSGFGYSPTGYSSSIGPTYQDAYGTNFSGQSSGGLTSLLGY